MADTAGGAARTAPTLPDELERLTNVIADVSTTITEAISAIKDSTKNLAKQVALVTDSKGEKEDQTKDAIDEAIKKIEDDLGDVLGDAFADFGKAVLDVATGDKGRFRKLDRTLRGRLREAAEAVVGNLLKGFGKSIFDNIKAKLKKQAKEAGGFGNFALDVAQDVARSVAEAVDAVMRGIGSGLRTLLRLTRRNSGGYIHTLFSLGG